MIFKNQTTNKISLSHYIAADLTIGIYEHANDLDEVVADKQIKKLRKIEKDVFKHSSNYCVEDFAISLSLIPDQHINLMKILGWISEYTGIPLGKQLGFFWVNSSDKQLGKGYSIAEYFISIDRYAELIAIEFKLKNLFSRSITQEVAA